MGFPQQFMKWVINCVTTTQFSINLNGVLVGFFPSERGQRQGNPISPYLFLIAMEVFSALLKWNVIASGFDYHHRCSSLKLSHTVFADDFFLISAATEHSFQVSKTTTVEFEHLSGLKPNMQKRHLFVWST